MYFLHKTDCVQGNTLLIWLVFFNTFLLMPHDYHHFCNCDKPSSMFASLPENIGVKYVELQETKHLCLQGIKNDVQDQQM